MAEAEGNEFRLPKNARPKTYSITINPDLEKFTFEGRVLIDLDVLKQTDALTLHAAGLEVDDVLVCQQPMLINASDIIFDTEKETVTFKLLSSLKTGSALLIIGFKGNITDKLTGFYRAKYTMPDGAERYMATTQFEAVDARRAFPCFDEPEYKARFTLTLVVPQDRTAISNMPEVEGKNADDPDLDFKKVIRFAETPPMSTYLLAFVVSDLECVEGRTKNGKLVRVFATPGKKEQCEYALEVGIKILEWQEEYFGIPYPLPKLDMAGIPDFAFGGMENWGLITYREEAILLDPQNATVLMKRTVARYIAHEIAHMWFGDLVTMKDESYLWLNESFATWFCAKTLNALFPEWKEWENFYTEITSACFAMDGLRSTHPVEMPVKNPKEINQIFDPITYNKGASLIRMLESDLNGETFCKGIKLYLTRHQYGNATTEDLWAALSEVSGKDVASMMNTWIKQPGYPLVKIDRNRIEEMLVVEFFQIKFSHRQKSQNRDDNGLWQIPMLINTSYGSQKTVLMLGKELTMTFPISDWIKVNSTGFYRVQYSPEMLEALYPAIESKEISTLDRVGLLNDTYALQEAGVIPATEYLRLAEHYRDETEYAVWSNLCSGLGGVITKLTHQPYHRELERFARSLFKKIYRDVGWKAGPCEDELKTLLRSLIIENMGYYGHRGARYTARYKFFHFLMDKRSLDPNLRDAVCNIAAQYGTKTIYEAILDLYRDAESQEEKSRYLYALGYFKDEKLLKKTLSFAMSPKVRSQDTVGVITAVAGNPKGTDLAWEFVKANWQELEKRYGEGISFILSNLVESTISRFDTPEKKQEAEEFFAAHPVPTASMALERALEQIDINIAWLERNRQAVGEWISNRP